MTLSERWIRWTNRLFDRLLASLRRDPEVSLDEYREAAKAVQEHKDWMQKNGGGV